MSLDRRSLLFLAAGAALTSGCGSTRASLGGPLPVTSPNQEPEYRLYPGDQIDVRTPTASELNQQLTVGPDGRIAMPMIGQVMAADLSLFELESELIRAYTPILRRPEVEVTLRQAGPLKVWVDGEVRTPGVYDMPGDIDAYQAIIMAGGFAPGARRDRVGLIRRGPGDVRMMRSLDLSRAGMEHVALRRMDVIYVPRTTLAEVAAFFTQVRDALPIGFNYTLGGQNQNF
jgi:polysaccharide biosynthesis/export protein PslD